MPNDERASFPRLHVGMVLPVVALLLGVWVFSHLADPPLIWPDPADEGENGKPVTAPTSSLREVVVSEETQEFDAEEKQVSLGVRVEPDLTQAAFEPDPEVEDPRSKMSKDLLDLIDKQGSNGPFRVIVQVSPDEFGHRKAILGAVNSWAMANGSEEAKELSIIDATVVDLRKDSLLALAERGVVSRISLDAPVKGAVSLSCASVGADLVRANSSNGTGYDGRGVTVAVLDSGAYRRHRDFEFERGLGEDEYEVREDNIDDLEHRIQRVMKADRSIKYRNVKDNGRLLSVDFAFGGGKGDDYYGHGTHVLGVVGSNGNESGEEDDPEPFIGVAPRANLLNVKVLDGDGAGFTSTVLEAMDVLVKIKDVVNLRVINISFGHPVFESYTTDPLTLACKVAVDAGISVVCAAGNTGDSGQGPVYGGINSPANAPWVITVGATDTHGTPVRSDDTVAPFSSRGPTAIDGLIKPDLVAPGVNVASSAGKDNKLAHDHPEIWVWKFGDDHDYIQLSGTSMAAPMVSGTLALMYQANPSLDPATAKFVLMYTAEKMTLPTVLEQGSGYLNAEGAVRMTASMRQDLGSLAEGDSSMRLDSLGNPVSLLPYSTIGGETVLFGVAIVYRGGILVSGNTMLDDEIMWGEGNVWADNLVYRPPGTGSRFVDPLGLVWRPGAKQSMMGLSEDTASSASENIIESNNILWRPPTQQMWSNSFLDPTTLEATSDEVLVDGINYRPPGAGFAGVNSIYLPTRPSVN